MICCKANTCCECCNKCFSDVIMLDSQIRPILEKIQHAYKPFQELLKQDLKNKLSSLKKENKKLYDEYLMYFLNKYSLEDYEELDKYLPKDLNG